MPGFNAAMVRRGLVIIAGLLAFGFCLLMLSKATLRHAYAHDASGYWARMASEGRAPTKEWWDSLGSQKGLCCSFADGFKVEDVDWDTYTNPGCDWAPPTAAVHCPNGTSHYRVRLKGQWVDVPPDAVVTSPNVYGPSVVWPICKFTDSGSDTQTPCGSTDAQTGRFVWAEGVEVKTIRCFLPSSMS